MTLDRTSYQGETIGVEVPITVDLAVVETEPGLRRRHPERRPQAGHDRDRPRRPGADLRRAGRHDPRRHADRGIPDPGLGRERRGPATAGRGRHLRRSPRRDGFAQRTSSDRPASRSQEHRSRLPTGRSAWPEPSRRRSCARTCRHRSGDQRLPRDRSDGRTRRIGALPSWDSITAGPGSPGDGRGTTRPGPRGPGHVRGADPRRQRGDPGHPRRRARRPAPGRPVGRGRDQPGHDLVGRPRLLRAQGRAQPAPVRLVPRRPPAVRVRGADRAARRRPTAGSTSSSRRAVSSSTSSRSSRPASATSPSGSRRSRPGSPPRACSRAPASAACRRARDDRRRHEPDGRGLAGHLPRPRAPLAADAVVLVAAQVQGDERAGEPRRRVPPAEAHVDACAPRAAPTTPRR